MRKTVPFLIFMGAFLLYFAFSPHVEAAMFNESLNGTYIIVDGMTNGATATNNTGGSGIYMGDAGAGPNRGWVCYDISDLDSGIIIDVLYFRYAGGGNNGNATIRSMTVNPVGTDPMIIFWDVGNGTVYAGGAASGFPVIGYNQQITLNAQARTDLTAAINNVSQDWFCIGFMAVSEAPGSQAWINSTETVGVAPEPTLYLQYHYNYQYRFTGAYYENGTAYNATVIINDSEGGEFPIYMNHTDQGYTTEPDAFYWDIGGGYARYLFSAGESENFTIFMPEDTFDVYEFTVKDHTGKTGLGDAYLEAYRTVNGTEYLIERMMIYLGNPVPMNLVVGRTYHLKVLFADGTRYDWGYFMAGDSTEINLILKAVTFTDQAQVLYNHIHVEATRTATMITVNYLDDRAHTQWANVTISVRGGGVAYAVARNNNSYTLNWAGLNNTLNYIVVLDGLHTDYGTWGRSFILDASFTFPDPPQLGGIFGDVDPDFLPFIICMISLLTFSVALREKGLMATMFIASILKLISWASWSNNLLAFGWFIAIGVALVAQGGKT